MVDGIVLPSLFDVQHQVFSGDCSIALDMVSWFSQFDLGEEMRNSLVFAAFGKLYRWTRLPMGLRQACDIAQLALEILMWQPPDEQKKCTKLGYIDNVKFSGKREEVIDSVMAFLARCHYCGASVNETPTDASREDVSKLVESHHDFIGIHVDHVNQTKKNTQKTLDKIKFIWENRVTQFTK
jgi:hypothetical protein